jgi:hypothetical protein
MIATLVRAASAARCVRVLVALSIGLSALTLAACKGKEDPITIPERPTASLQPAPVDDGITATSLGSALDQTRSKMVDGPASPLSEGVKLFGGWAQQHLAWEDIDPKAPETTVARADADPVGERGKKLCESGTIIEMTSDDLRGAKIAIGVLARNSVEILQFVAVRSTGSLAERSNVRFCGIMAARVDRAARTGGMGNLIQVVWMFDLPENRKPLPGSTPSEGARGGSVKLPPPPKSTAPTGRAISSSL